MFKKNILTLMALLFLSSLAYGEVSVKDLGNGEAEITFTYQDDDAAEMNVIGSFNSWIEPGDVMVKNAAGLWEFKLVTFADDEIIYKFFDGTYISDENAPDEKDDGFAGMNGLILVADLLLEVPAAPVADGETPKAPVKKARKKSTFSTETYIESDTKFSTADNKFEAVDSTINAKSVWKFEGDLTKNMPGYLELTFFDGNPTVWSDPVDDDDDGIKLDDGMETLASGFIFNPVYFFGGDEKPVLDKFSFGFVTKYITYDTGYGNSLIPGHNSVIWETVEDGIDEDGEVTIENKARDGYSSFNSVVDLDGIGLKIDTTIVPNKSLDDKYGFFGIINTTKGPLRADLQYEMQSLVSDKAQNMFENIPRQDLILGLSYNSSPIEISTQVLNSAYPKNGAAMMRPIEDRLAAAVKLAYTQEEDFGLTIAFKTRGYAAQMLFADNDVVLGEQDTQTADLGAFFKINSVITPRLDVIGVIAGDEAKAKNGTKSTLTFEPGVKFDFTEKLGKTTTGDIYVNIGMNTDEADEETPTVKVGATATVENITLNYGYDGSEDNVTFNSLLLQSTFQNDITAELGLGLRDGDDVTNAFGASIGVSWKIPAPKAKDPILYANFSYNLDPYKTGETEATLKDYQMENSSEGEAAIRVGIVWNY